MRQARNKYSRNRTIEAQHRCDLENQIADNRERRMQERRRDNECDESHNGPLSALGQQVRY
jgi:hypothetical protein